MISEFIQIINVNAGDAIHRRMKRPEIPGIIEISGPGPIGCFTNSVAVSFGVKHDKIGLRNLRPQ